MISEREKRGIAVSCYVHMDKWAFGWALRNGENSGREHWRKSPPWKSNKKEWLPESSKKKLIEGLVVSNLEQPEVILVLYSLETPHGCCCMPWPIPSEPCVLEKAHQHLIGDFCGQCLKQGVNWHFSQCVTGGRGDMGRPSTLPPNVKQQGQTASSPLSVPLHLNVYKSLILASVARNWQLPLWCYVEKIGIYFWGQPANTLCL